MIEERRRFDAKDWIVPLRPESEVAEEIEKLAWLSDEKLREGVERLLQDVFGSEPVFSEQAQRHLDGLKRPIREIYDCGLYREVMHDHFLGAASLEYLEKKVMAVYRGLFDLNPTAANALRHDHAELFNIIDQKGNLNDWEDLRRFILFADKVATLRDEEDIRVASEGRRRRALKIWEPPESLSRARSIDFTLTESPELHDAIDSLRNFMNQSPHLSDEDTILEMLPEISVEMSHLSISIMVADINIDSGASLGDDSSSIQLKMLVESKMPNGQPKAVPKVIEVDLRLTKDDIKYSNGNSAVESLKDWKMYNGALAAAEPYFEALPEKPGMIVNRNRNPKVLISIINQLYHPDEEIDGTKPHDYAERIALLAGAVDGLIENVEAFSAVAERMMDMKFFREEVRKLVEVDGYSLQGLIDGLQLMSLKYFDFNQKKVTPDFDFEGLSRELERQSEAAGFECKTSFWRHKLQITARNNLGAGHLHFEALLDRLLVEHGLDINKPLSDHRVPHQRGTNFDVYKLEAKNFYKARIARELCKDIHAHHGDKIGVSREEATNQITLALEDGQIVYLKCYAGEGALNGHESNNFYSVVPAVISFPEETNETPELITFVHQIISSSWERVSHK